MTTHSWSRLCNGILIIMTIGYWFFLTNVLLASDPWVMVHGDKLIRTAPDTSNQMTSIFLHIVCYSILGFLITVLLVNSSRLAFFAFFALAALHGIATEVLQQWIPNRCPGILDALSNEIGIVLGWYLAYLTIPKVFLALHLTFSILRQKIHRIGIS